MIFILISILLLIPYAALLYYYRNAWLSIPAFEPVDDLQELPFVSVIISARNEELKIGDCIRSLIGQSYPAGNFEVIIINDHSEDNTAGVVNSFAGNVDFIKLVQLVDFVKEDRLNSYKKKAIETGIGIAKGELIMTTDADCIVPKNWIFSVASYYRQHHSAMIASPVSISLPGSQNLFQRLFSIFQILDFTTLQGITGAALFKEFHYMANGANLAYPQNIFLEVEGFKDVDSLASGDDMFLMEKVRKVRPHKIHYLKSEDSTVTTLPEPTLKAFFNQRIRWASKSSTYLDYKIKSVLGLVYMVNVWMVILFAGLIFGHNVWLAIIFFVLKIVIELYFLFPVSKFFRQQKLLVWFIPLQPVHVLYIIITGWMGKFGSYHWKGRKVK